MHLVHRRGGMPCWITFSLAVPGFALRNRFRAVRDLCFVGGGGSIVRVAAHFSRSNVSIHPRCTLCTVGVECLVGFHFHWLFLASLSEIVSAWFVTFVSSVVEGPLCARLPIYFLIQRQGSGDPAPCDGYPGPHCWIVFRHFLIIRSR